jgi:hypothetical protein
LIFFNINFTVENCYNSSSSGIWIGLSEACPLEVTILKGPFSYVTFSQESTVQQCTQIEFYLLKKSAFTVAKTSAFVSFQFDHKIAQGVVINENGATIGAIVGDGIEFIPEYPERIQSFYLCFLVSQNISELDMYPIKDFGYTTGSFSNIYPLEYNDRLLISPSLNSHEFWCANVTKTDFPTFNEEFRFFPIVRVDDYEQKEHNLYSFQTRVLLYTLGAFYCLDLLLLLIFLIYLFISIRHAKQKSVPIVAYLGSILCVLCIFRIVFCFLWPVNGFGDNSVAEYAVFEIPTFLLFSAVILAIGYWRKLSNKKYYFFFFFLFVLNYNIIR